MFNYPSPIDAYYFPFASQEYSHPIYVLNNNLSNYQLTVVDQNKVIAASTQGFVFTESDFEKLAVKKPFKNGIYARVAFNGMLPLHFQFKQGDTFANNAFTVEILELTEAGLVNAMQFNFHDNNTDNSRNQLFFYWDSENKNFEALSLEENFNENKSLIIKNW